MALRIFGRKKEQTQELPRPAGDRVMPPAGDRVQRPANDPIPPPAFEGTDEHGMSGRTVGESSWRPEGGMMDESATRAPAPGARTPRAQKGSPRQSTRGKAARSTKGKSQKAKGSRKPARRAKQATNRKPASKRAKTGQARKARSGGTRSR